jgi:hypothetical protein
MTPRRVGGPWASCQAVLHLPRDFSRFLYGRTESGHPSVAAAPVGAADPPKECCGGMEPGAGENSRHSHAPSGTTVSKRDRAFHGISPVGLPPPVPEVRMRLVSRRRNLGTVPTVPAMSLNHMGTGRRAAGLHDPRNNEPASHAESSPPKHGRRRRTGVGSCRRSPWR